MARGRKVELSIAQEIREIEAALTHPAKRQEMRDALTLKIVEGLARRDDGGPIDARWIHSLVDALMDEREVRVQRELEGLEAGVRRTLSTSGMKLASNGEVLAAALIARFGGSIEIPEREMKDAEASYDAVRVKQTEEGGPLTFTLIEVPR